MNNLKYEEKVVFALRFLYQSYGYKQYQMSKFEEYDLYLKNKNFLVSDNIITFTDTDGKLLALKPDVTLSIVKNLNYGENTLKKVYYNENVYRVARGTNSFKEIMQTGLECIGNIDDYVIFETIMLAAKSLAEISDDYVMDISHMGIMADILEKTGASDNAKKDIQKCIATKNVSGLSLIEKREGLDLKNLKELITTHKTADEVLPFLESIDSDFSKSFIKVISALEESGFKNKVRIDFSLTGDVNYYNGFVFKGFINGIPSSVLSGGQYDNLMAKFKRTEKAIGFAVYLDMIERLDEKTNDFDVDTVLLYDEKIPVTSVYACVNELSKGGKTVLAQPKMPKKIRYMRLAKLSERGVEFIENNA